MNYNRLDFLRLTILSLVVMLSHTGVGWAETYELNTASSEVGFQASSTLHEFQANSRQIQKAQVQFDFQSLKSGAFEVSVPVASLDTDNRARNSMMYKMFDTAKYPQIIWKSQMVKCELFSADGQAVCHAAGFFNIHGKSVFHEMPVRLKRQGNDLLAEGNIDFTMEEFSLKPPTVLGFIHVNNPIRVYLKILWKKIA